MLSEKIKESSLIKNIVLIGVGGQGTILVSKIISSALVTAGKDVKMSEIHGMAQRGGSVLTQIRYGENVHSPIISEGEADILVAFEKMEALRGSKYLRPQGTIVVNDYTIMPLPAATGRVSYPSSIVDSLREKYNTISIDAGEAAIQLGASRVMNVVLLGALVEGYNMTEFDWDRALVDNIKPQFLNLNISAFAKGRQLAAETIIQAAI
ncbi:MAG TPA: indolepyruvate oxidoreductase subunit beta [Clostridiaceae bacterium]|nr:indolepyruvate oxidoreductase subunit beta [Clostridiaceae bacterium]